MSDDPSVIRRWAACPECGRPVLQAFLCPSRVDPWERSARAAGLLVYPGNPLDGEDCFCRAWIAVGLRSAAALLDGVEPGDLDVALRLVRFAEARIVDLERRSGR